MELICTSCFLKPAPKGAAHPAEQTVVCPEGDVMPGRPSAQALHCDHCGHPIHFDGLTRVWYAH